MRILLTGTTTLMSNQQRQSTSTFLSFFPLLNDMLVELGHQVDWRAVKPGDRLSRSYDVALLGLQAVNGLAGKQYRYGTLWAAHELPHAVVFDDWQVRTSARSLMNPQNFWKSAMLGRRELEERRYALEYCEDQLERVRVAWFEQLPYVIAPLFHWGIHSRFTALHPMKKLIPIDPSHFVPVLGAPPEDGVKDRAWVYAGLKDYGEKLRGMGFSWEVKTKMPITGRRGWGRVPEVAVVNELYRHNWGVISMPYTKLLLGTGWWRSRFNFAAQVGSVLWADKREIGYLDPSLYGLSAARIESMPERALKMLAWDQAEELDRWKPTREQMLAHLDDHLKEIYQHGQAIQ